MNFKEYTITSGDLARIHGVVQSTIFNWTKQGAFPHILTAGGQSRYDQRSGTMLPGEIKRNIADKKWVRPIATIERNKRATLVGF